jgi:cell division transport system permease protein
MARGGAELPLDGDPSTRFLPWVAAAVVYLAALALAAALTAREVIDRWQAALTGAITVEVPFPQAPADDERVSAAARRQAQTERIQAAMRVLLSTSGVGKVEPLDTARARQLLEPWLGSGGVSQDLPLPTLIDVSFARDAAPNLGDLAERLAQAVPGSRLDDHGLWLDGVRSLARAAQGLAVAVIAVVGLVAAAAVAFATRTGLSIHRDVVEVLHLIGAHNSYIGRQFSRHMFRLSLTGGALGLGAALATLAGVSQVLDVDVVPALQSLRLGLIGWLCLGFLPPIAGLVAWFAARLAVARQLARLL